MTARAEPGGERSERRAPAGDAAGGDAVLVPRDSERRPTVSVVLPTLNEEQGVLACIEDVKAALAEMGVTGEIIVSDSSTDRTPELARAAGATVVTPDRRGYGYAYRYAFRQARGDYVAMGDADTTYDFRELPKLFEAVASGDADIAMGSRYAGTIEPGAMPALHRYVGNPALTGFLNLFYDAGVTDAHSGFRVLSREALDRLDLRTDGMEFASEMIVAAAVNGLEIAEVPITYHERRGEEKLDSFRDGWRHVKFMLTNAPGYVFSLPAVAFLLVGAVAMALSLLGARAGPVTFGTHTMIAGSLLAIVGYQVGSLAVFSTVATDAIRRPRDPITNWIRESLRIEHGVLVGVLLCAAGGVYFTALLLWWLASGRVGFPLIVWNVLALTTVVVGVQTVFQAFFLSMLGESDLGRSRAATGASAVGTDAGVDSSATTDGGESRP